MESIRWTPVNPTLSAIKEEGVKVNIQVKGAAKALDQRDRTGGGIFELIPSLVYEVGRDRPVHDANQCWPGTSNRRDRAVSCILRNMQDFYTLLAYSEGKLGIDQEHQAQRAEEILQQW